jgi:transposase-like protein
MSTTRRRYSVAFKAEAERLLGTGLPVAEVASALDAPPMTIWNWYYQARDAGRLPGTTATLSVEESRDPVILAQRLRALEEKVAVMEEEQRILGKVSAFFATQRQTSTGSAR